MSSLIFIQLAITTVVNASQINVWEGINQEAMFLKNIY